MSMRSMQSAALRETRSPLAHRGLFAAVLFLVPLLGLNAQAFGQGAIIANDRLPDDDMPGRRIDRERPIRAWMPFEVQSIRIDTRIDNDVAETTMEQVFINKSRRPVEGTYIFPIATDAAVHKFTMRMNGREVEAELLDAAKARSIYESIVARMKDPALLEYDGRGLIKASVFPIPPDGECKISLKYTEPIKIDARMGTYTFPLRAAGADTRPIGTFSLNLNLRTTAPLATVFCPSHPCTVSPKGEHEANLSMEISSLQPDADVRIFYKTTDKPFGLALLTQPGEGDEDGFFLARLAPRFGTKQDSTLPKNICFVLDTSGSMADDDKIAQAKKALKFCLSNLGEDDRFNLITFATEVQAFSDGWSRTDDAAIKDAKAFVSDLKAVGGTDIDAAMKHALSLHPLKISEPDPLQDSVDWRRNPYIIVFITDGEPTVGETDPDKILAHIAADNGTGEGASQPANDQTPGLRSVARPENDPARIFVLGVGYHVNTKLLDRMADDNGGARDYVTPSEDLELKISAFYSKLANPILATLELIFEGVSVHDVYPKQLPDLFQGSELVVLGRYKEPKGAEQKVVLSGKMRDHRETFHYPCTFSKKAADGPGTTMDFLPRLWAVRKIGYLLDELRLHGHSKEVIDEIVRLSRLYGIMTPYTSFLVQEDGDARIAAGGRGAAREEASAVNRAMTRSRERNKGERKAAASAQRRTTGAASVGASTANQQMQIMADGETAGLLQGINDFNRDEAGLTVMNYIGSRTFYRDGERWVDSGYDGTTKPIPLPLYSSAYYDFVRENRGVGRYLAQGDRVILCWNGRVYETQPATPTSQPGS